MSAWSSLVNEPTPAPASARRAHRRAGARPRARRRARAPRRRGGRRAPGPAASPRASPTAPSASPIAASMPSSSCCSLKVSLPRRGWARPRRGRRARRRRGGGRRRDGLRARQVVRAAPLVERDAAVALEREDARRDLVEEPAIVRDDQRAAGERRQRLLEHAQRHEVEIVGRLVEDEEVAAGAQQLAPAARGCARRPRATPTGVSAKASSKSSMRRKVRTWTGAVLEEDVVVVAGDLLEHGLVVAQRRARLVEEGEARVLPDDDLARVGRDLAEDACAPAWSCRRRSGRRRRCDRPASRAGQVAEQRPCRRATCRGRGARGWSCPAGRPSAGAAPAGRPRRSSRRGARRPPPRRSGRCAPAAWWCAPPAPRRIQSSSRRTNAAPLALARRLVRQPLAPASRGSACSRRRRRRSARDRARGCAWPRGRGSSDRG